MSTPSVLQLQDELTARIKSTTTFAESGFQIYDLNDLHTYVQAGAALPMAGISYEGSEILQQEINTNRKSTGSSSVNTQRIRFSVIIGISYQGAGGPDTKVTAIALLQEVRNVLHGYRQVNSRPWSFISERPLDGDTEGVIYYGQLWMTDVFLTGNHIEQ